MIHDSKVEQIVSTSDEIAQLLIKKNHDYGDSFFDVYEEFGDLSTFIRLKDKMGRLENLIQGSEMLVKDEPIEDVYRDIAGYCILTLISKNMQKKGGMNHALDSQGN